jgi:hypothetical protein
MKEAELRLLFDSGLLKSVTVCRHPMVDSWMLQFERKKGDSIFLDSQRLSPRSFKTLDAAFQIAHDIGFEQVTVVRVHG